MLAKSKHFNGGQWRIDGEDLVQCTRATMQPVGPMLLFGDLEWTDCDLRFDAMAFDGSEGFKVLFRAVDSQNMCGVGLGSYGNRFHDIWCVDQGEWKKGAHATTQGSIEYGCWYHVEVRARGNKFCCLLDGVNVLHSEYPYALPAGLVGFSTWDTIVAFRNIEVYSPDKALLWIGLPQIVAC